MRSSVLTMRAPATSMQYKSYPEALGTITCAKRDASVSPGSISYKRSVSCGVLGFGLRVWVTVVVKTGYEPFEREREIVYGSGVGFGVQVGGFEFRKKESRTRFGFEVLGLLGSGS